MCIGAPSETGSCLISHSSASSESLEIIGEDLRDEGVGWEDDGGRVVLDDGLGDAGAGGGAGRGATNGVMTVDACDVSSRRGERVLELSSVPKWLEESASCEVP